jgi:hypothetical protein
LRRALRFVDGNFNTPCPAFRFGTSVGAGRDVVVASSRFILEVGVPISDDEMGVELCPLGEYDGGP